MNFEDLQKTWQAQKTGAQVRVDTETLLKVMRRNEQQFRSLIFQRDVREVGVCGVMTVAFGVWGWRWGWWSMYVLAGCCLFVGAFFVVDRLLQRRKQPVKTDSLQDCLASSLHQVDHQIWLLRNVFWWYLLPILIGLSAVTGTTVWSVHAGGTAAMTETAAVYIIVYGLTYWGVYWVNQYAVRKDLEPRRQELARLLAELN